MMGDKQNAKGEKLQEAQRHDGSSTSVAGSHTERNIFDNLFGTSSFSKPAVAPHSAKITQKKKGQGNAKVVGKDEPQKRSSGLFAAIAKGAKNLPVLSSASGKVTARSAADVPKEIKSKRIANKTLDRNIFAELLGKNSSDGSLSHNGDSVKLKKKSVHKTSSVIVTDSTKSLPISASIKTSTSDLLEDDNDGSQAHDTNSDSTSNSQNLIKTPEKNPHRSPAKTKLSSPENKNLQKDLVNILANLSSAKRKLPLIDSPSNDTDVENIEDGLDMISCVLATSNDDNGKSSMSSKRDQRRTRDQRHQSHDHSPCKSSEKETLAKNINKLPADDDSSSDKGGSVISISARQVAQQDTEPVDMNDSCISLNSSKSSMCKEEEITVKDTESVEPGEILNLNSSKSSSCKGEETTDKDTDSVELGEILSLNSSKSSMCEAREIVDQDSADPNINLSLNSSKSSTAEEFVNILEEEERMPEPIVDQGGLPTLEPVDIQADIVQILDTDELHQPPSLDVYSKGAPSTKTPPKSVSISEVGTSKSSETVSKDDPSSDVELIDTGDDLQVILVKKKKKTKKHKLDKKMKALKEQTIPRDKTKQHSCNKSPGDKKTKKKQHTCNKKTGSGSRPVNSKQRSGNHVPTSGVVEIPSSTEDSDVLLVEESSSGTIKETPLKRPEGEEINSNDSDRGSKVVRGKDTSLKADKSKQLPGIKMAAVAKTRTERQLQKIATTTQSRKDADTKAVGEMSEDSDVQLVNETEELIIEETPKSIEKTTSNEIQMEPGPIDKNVKAVDAAIADDDSSSKTVHDNEELIKSPLKLTDKTNAKKSKDGDIEMESTRTLIEASPMVSISLEFKSKSESMQSEIATTASESRADAESTTRPGTAVDAKSRPGLDVDVKSTTRPGSAVDAVNRPGSAVDAGSITRPVSESAVDVKSTTRPGSTVDAESTIRPGSVMDDESTIRPGSAVEAESMPGSAVEAESTTRPGSAVDSESTTRPGSGSTVDAESTTRPVSAVDAELLSEDDSMDLSEVIQEGSLGADSFLDNASNLSFAGTEESSEIGSSTLDSRDLDTPSTSRQSGFDADVSREEVEEEDELEGNPDVDDIDDVTFLSFGSKDELDLHLKSLMQNPAKKIVVKKTKTNFEKASVVTKSKVSPGPEPQKQVTRKRIKKKSMAMKNKPKCWVSLNYHALMNQLEESEEKMLEELEIHANREFLHPSLKEAGMCLHVSSLSTDPVGRVFILDPVGVDLSLEEPFKVSQRDIFFPQRTKTSDYTKVKGWRDDGKQLKTILVPQSTRDMRAGPKNKGKLGKTKPQAKPETSVSSKISVIQQPQHTAVGKTIELRQPPARAASKSLFKNARKTAMQLVRSSRTTASALQKKTAAQEPVREPIKLILPKPKSMLTRNSPLRKTKSIFKRTPLSPVKHQTRAVSQHATAKPIAPSAPPSPPPIKSPAKTISPKKSRLELVPPITLAFKKPKTAAEAAVKGMKRAMIVKKPSPPVLSEEEESETVKPIRDYAAVLKDKLGSSDTKEESKIPFAESILFKSFEKPVVSKTTAFVSNTLDEYLKKDKNSTSTEFNPFSHPLLQNKSSVVTFQMPSKQQRGIKTLHQKLEERKLNALKRRRQISTRGDGDTITVKPFIPPGKSLKQHIADESVKPRAADTRDKTTMGRTKNVDKLYEQRVAFLRKINERHEQKDPDEPEYLGMIDDSDSDDVYSRSVTGPRILGHITGTCRTKATAINQRQKDATAAAKGLRTKSSVTNVYKPKTTNETDPDVYEIESSSSGCRTKASETVRYGGLVETTSVKSKTVRKNLMGQLAQKIRSTQGKPEISKADDTQSKGKWKTQLQITNSKMMHKTNSVTQSRSQSFMPIRDPNSPPMKGILISGGARGKSKLTVDSTGIETTRRKVLESDVVLEEDVEESDDNDDVQIIDLPDCGKEFCRMGCICDSLKEAQNTHRPRGHCGKSVCMFKCICTRATDKVRILRHRKRPSVFNSDDMYFYDTVGMMSNIQASKKPRLLDTLPNPLSNQAQTAASCARTRLYNKLLPSSHNLSQEAIQATEEAMSHGTSKNAVLKKPAGSTETFSQRSSKVMEVVKSIPQSTPQLQYMQQVIDSSAHPVIQLPQEPVNSDPAAIGHSHFLVLQQAGQYVLKVNPSTQQLYAMNVNDPSGKATMLPAKMKTVSPQMKQVNTTANPLKIASVAAQPQLLSSSNVSATTTQPASTSMPSSNTIPCSSQDVGNNVHVIPGAPSQAFPVSLQKVDTMSPAINSQSVGMSDMSSQPITKTTDSQPVTQTTYPVSGSVSSAGTVTSAVTPTSISRSEPLISSVNPTVASGSEPVSSAATLTFVSGSGMVSTTSTPPIMSAPEAVSSPLPKSSPQVLGGAVVSTHPGLVKADIFMTSSGSTQGRVTSPSTSSESTPGEVTTPSTSSESTQGQMTTPSTLNPKTATPGVESSIASPTTGLQVLDPQTGILSEYAPSSESTTSDAAKKKKKKKKEKKEKKNKRDKKHDKDDESQTLKCDKHSSGSCEVSTHSSSSNIIPNPDKLNSSTTDVPTPSVLSNVSSSIPTATTVSSDSSNPTTPIPSSNATFNLPTPVLLTNAVSNVLTPITYSNPAASNVSTTTSNVTPSSARPVPIALVPASSVATTSLSKHALSTSPGTSGNITFQSTSNTSPISTSSITASLPVQLAKHTGSGQPVYINPSSISRTTTATGAPTTQQSLVTPSSTCYIVPGKQPHPMIIQTGPSGQPGNKLVLLSVAGSGVSQISPETIIQGPVIRQPSKTPQPAGASPISLGTTVRPVSRSGAIPPADTTSNPPHLPRHILPAGVPPSAAPWKNIASKGGSLVIGSSSSGHLMMAGTKTAASTISSTKAPTLPPVVGTPHNTTTHGRKSLPDPMNPRAATPTSSSVIDITSSPPAGSASSKKSASGPMLIEIQSDCNWDKHKEEILSKIAKHTTGEGLQPGHTSMRVGKYVVEIVSKKEESVAVTDKGTVKTTVSKQPVELKAKVDKGITTFFPPSGNPTVSATTTDSEVIVLDDSLSTAPPSKRPNTQTSGKDGSKVSKTSLSSSRVQQPLTNPNSPDIIEMLSADDVPEVIDIPDSPPRPVTSTDAERMTVTETGSTTTVSNSIPIMSVTETGSTTPVSNTGAITTTHGTLPVSKGIISSGGAVPQSGPIQSTSLPNSSGSAQTIAPQQSDAPPLMAPVPVGIVKLSQDDLTCVTSEKQQQEHPSAGYRPSSMPPLQAAPTHPPAVRFSNVTGANYTIIHPKQQSKDMSDSSESADVDVEEYEEDIDVEYVDDNLSTVVTNLKRKLGVPLILAAPFSSNKKQKGDKSNMQIPNVKKRKRKSVVMPTRNVYRLDDLTTPKFMDEEEDESDSDDKIMNHNIKERERRSDMRDQFARLNNLLFGEVRVNAKVKILSSAYEEIAVLEKQAKQLRQVKINLQEINVRLNQKLAKTVGPSLAQSEGHLYMETPLARSVSYSHAINATAATGVKIDVQVPDDEKLDPVQRIGPQTAQDRDEANRHSEEEEEEAEYISGSSSAEEVDISQFVDSSEEEEDEDDESPERIDNREPSHSQRQPQGYYKGRLSHQSDSGLHSGLPKVVKSKLELDKTKVSVTSSTSQPVRVGSKVTVTSSLSQLVKAGLKVTVPSSTSQPIRAGSKVTVTSSTSQPIRAGSKVTVTSSTSQPGSKVTVTSSTSQPVITGSKVTVTSSLSQQAVRTAFHSGLPQVVSTRSLATFSKSDKDNAQKQGIKLNDMPAKPHQEQSKRTTESILQIAGKYQNKSQSFPQVAVQNQSKAHPTTQIAVQNQSMAELVSQIAAHHQSKTESTTQIGVQNQSKTESTTQIGVQTQSKTQSTSQNADQNQSKLIQQIQPIAIQYKSKAQASPQIAIQHQSQPEAIEPMAITYKGKPQSISQETVCLSIPEPERTAAHSNLPKVMSVTSLAPKTSSPTSITGLPASITCLPASKSDLPASKTSLPASKTVSPASITSLPAAESSLPASSTGLPKVVSVTSLADSPPGIIQYKMQTKTPDKISPSTPPPVRTILPKVVPPISLAKPKSPKRSDAPATWSIVSPKRSPEKAILSPKKVSPVKVILSPKTGSSEKVILSPKKVSPVKVILSPKTVSSEKAILSPKKVSPVKIILSPNNISPGKPGIGGSSAARQIFPVEVASENSTCDDLGSDFTNLKTRTRPSIAADAHIPEQLSRDKLAERGGNDKRPCEQIEMCDEIAKESISMKSTQKFDKSTTGVTDDSMLAWGNDNDAEDSIEDLMRDQGIMIATDESIKSTDQRVLGGKQIEGIIDGHESMDQEKMVVRDSVQLQHLVDEGDVSSMALTNLQSEETAEDDATGQSGDKSAAVDETISAIDNIPQPSRTPSPIVGMISERGDVPDSELSLNPNIDSKANRDEGEPSHVDLDMIESPGETDDSLASAAKLQGGNTSSPDKKNKVDLMSCLGVRENPDGTMRVVLQGEYDDDAVEEFFARPEVMDYLETLAMKKTQQNNPINSLF